MDGWLDGWLAGWMAVWLVLACPRPAALIGQQVACNWQLATATTAYTALMLHATNSDYDDDVDGHNFKSLRRSTQIFKTNRRCSSCMPRPLSMAGDVAEAETPCLKLLQGVNAWVQRCRLRCVLWGRGRNFLPCGSLSNHLLHSGTEMLILCRQSNMTDGELADN